MTRLIEGYQSPTGVTIVTEEPPKDAQVLQRVAIYARDLSHEHRSNLERQMKRLEDSCADNGNNIVTAVKEVVSGVNDVRPKFLALLADRSITIIVVEHKHRATRFGFRFHETFFGLAGWRIEAVNLAANEREDEALRQKSSIINSCATRLYGQRRADRKTGAIVKQLKAEEDT